MSLKKKDQSAPGGLRVAANDPHLVSLGGGRLSTAVTIHYLPVGDMTIGSSTTCDISLNGSGVRPLHCTVFRSESGEVTIVPENDARVLIDGDKIASEANLTQGAMLTIGNSNYLRFNNPAEAQLIKSTMGSNERISMPQIDFTQENTNGSNGEFLGSPDDVLKSFNEAMESQNNQKFNNGSVLEKITKIEYININNFHSPKVFAADSVTVNAPAKDVLGPKYASFAKNLAENHRNDKNFRTKNNEIALKTNNYVNIPSTFIQNSPNSSNSEVLTKVHNNSMSGRSHYQMTAASTYDRYPKPGFGGLQLFPMNCINSEINTISTENHYQNQNQQQSSSYSADGQNSHQENAGESKMTAQEHERFEEILKICTEYDRQNQNVQSSPIVQNRIKTNGSLPREKKSPFHEINPQHSKAFFPDKTKTNSGYENVKILGDRRIEIGGVSSNGQKSSSGYENVIVGKYIPQSPRTKIRTTCVSPKKEVAITGIVPAPLPLPFASSSAQSSHASQATEYAHLIQSFEDKLRMEMEAIKECQNNCQSPYDSPKKRPNLNINNLTLNLEQATSQNTSTNQNSEVSQNGESHVDLEKVKKDRELVLAKIRKIKTQIADLQREQDEVVREMDMEKALVFAELTTVNADRRDMERNLSTLQGKIHRLEAQRNANRVMQETQQSKLKQSIEMKQDQVSRLENLMNQNSIDETLKEELTKMTECLENDRKTFEDLEFQYLEEETDWLAYREELHTDLKLLTKSIDEKRMQVLHLESQTVDNQHAASSDTKTLEKNLLSLLTALERYRSELQRYNRILRETSDCHINLSESEDDDGEENNRNRGNLMMSQSLFGSAELLSAKSRETDLMSRSVNENLFFDNNIEMPSQSIDRLATSTPKKSLKIFDISDDVTNIAQNGHSQLKKAEDLDITPEIVRRENNDEKDPILRLKYNVDVPLEEQQKRVNLNLSLGSDDFEVNPLERRVPSQDDIDRICKVTLDAPISTKGASSKIIESIKEIERNRQLLLAQQGSHVIEHERQKMVELKKKSHDEARAQYLSLQGGQMSPSHHNASLEQRDYESDEKERSLSPQKDSPESLVNDNATENSYSQLQINGVVAESSQHRHSHPEFEPPRERPLSEVNSELSYDNLSDKQSRSNNDLISHRLSETSEDAKRSSLVSNGTSEGDRLVSGNKRSLPKHQRPLTRYLPIFSPDLDLRQHIESAGHQVGLCPHVFVESYSCRGYLHKLGATFHGWSRRWFVLDRQKKALIYYSDKSERKARGGAYFSTIDEVYLDHLNTSKSGRPHCTFIVKTKKRSYHLQAASDAAARIWIDAIITGAQGNFDY